MCVWLRLELSLLNIHNAAMNYILQINQLIFWLIVPKKKQNRQMNCFLPFKH